MTPYRWPPSSVTAATGVNNLNSIQRSVAQRAVHEMHVIWIGRKWRKNCAPQTITGTRMFLWSLISFLVKELVEFFTSSFRKFASVGAARMKRKARWAPFSWQRRTSAGGEWIYIRQECRNTLQRNRKSKVKKEVCTFIHNSLLYHRATCFDALPGRHQVAAHREIKMFTTAKGRRILLDKNYVRVLLYARARMLVVVGVVEIVVVVKSRLE